MQAGTSKGTSSMTASSPFSPLIAKFAKSFLPSAKAFGQQETEALKTGGVNAQIPIINRAVDASRGAESSANQDTQQALARAGLADTSFGAQILGNQKMQGAQNTAAIPGNIAGQFISAVPGTASTGVGAAEGAAASNYSSSGRTSNTASFMDQLQQGVQTVTNPQGKQSTSPGGGSAGAFGASKGMAGGAGAVT